jgi:hypothetical protein
MEIHRYSDPIFYDYHQSSVRDQMETWKVMSRHADNSSLQLQQCGRDRLEFYLDHSCDRLKTCRDGYVLMGTEKRQRGNPPTACTIPGDEINLRQCHDSYKEKKKNLFTHYIICSVIV